MTKLSILDLAPVTAGSDAGSALRKTLDLAQRAESWGYHRYWLAEHHNMPGIASAATSVVIGQVAAATSAMRVGAGGIMLPNHSPLVIAEQFGTLEALFPGRIDLGLGRAPGTDPHTSRALRRDVASAAERFPQDVVELQAYFDEPAPDQRIRAIPGAGLKVPIWILGSSLFGAQLAAKLGLPYAFASHFAPAQMMPALEVYRDRFEPSAQLDRPYAMLGYNVFAADTTDEARTLASSMEQAFVSLRRGGPAQFQPPREGYRDTLDPADRALLDQMLSCSAVGDLGTVRRTIDEFISRTGADELILSSPIYDHAARLRSYELTAELIPRETGHS